MHRGVNAVMILGMNDATKFLQALANTCIVWDSEIPAGLLHDTGKASEWELLPIELY